jgi:hypothetical protein
MEDLSMDVTKYNTAVSILFVGYSAFCFQPLTRQPIINLCSPDASSLQPGGFED